ncbi:MAG TPA: LytR C-terminal domain-containing protein [Gemmatimonadaceae bacterium]|nr:LytR C-terminal domain-containing protein [Gemmatimonadaceae bacterium]
MTRTGPRYGRIVLALLLVVGLGWAGWRLSHWRRSDLDNYAPADARAPEGTRIKVEVLNGTRTPGLARRATRYLRDRGFDVVGSGTNIAPRATTVVYDRSSHPVWARLVARALNATAVSQPDSSRYLDVTVVLGADWRPPPLPFNP